MAKTSAWCFTLVGLAFLPPVKTWIESMGSAMWWWLVAVLFLIVGITKLVRNYSSRRR